MKRFVFFLVVLLLSLSACRQLSGETISWQEQYDLGVRFLSEGNYEEAIIAFEAAIEIDPKRAETYLGLADSYVRMGDLEKAKEALNRGVEAAEDAAALESRLQELSRPQPKEGYPKTERSDYGDGRYDTTEYNEYGNLVLWMQYRANGDVANREEHTYDENQLLLQHCNEHWQENGDYYKYIAFYSPDGRIYRSESTSISTYTGEEVCEYAYVPGSTQVSISCYWKTSDTELAVEKQTYDMKSPDNIVNVYSQGSSSKVINGDQVLLYKSMDIIEFTKDNSWEGRFANHEGQWALRTSFRYDESDSLIDIETVDTY